MKRHLLTTLTVLALGTAGYASAGPLLLLTGSAMQQEQTHTRHDIADPRAKRDTEKRNSIGIAHSATSHQAPAHNYYRNNWMAWP
jgi:hypothetical protein